MDEGPGTILSADDEEFLTELSDYLEILGNSSRLRILRLLEKRPLDTRSISLEIETSYENTKKHLDKLLSIGVIRKEAGLGAPTSKGIHPVWEYSLVPGGLEAIIRNLGLFSNKKVQILEAEINNRLTSVKGALNKEILGNKPAAIVLGGVLDGKIFLLKKDIVNIGRIDKGNTAKYNPVDDIVLPEEYSAVTRVSHPHGRLFAEKGAWFFEDCGSTGGTMVNNHKVAPRQRTPVSDGDLLEMSRGLAGVRLLLIIPKPQ